MTLEKAKKMLEEEYEWAKKLEWVEHPLAYALYHTWRRAEIEEENERTNDEQAD